LRNPDYIIVGAGSAGYVLASRLTEDSDSDAVVLEAGGSDRSIMIAERTADIIRGCELLAPIEVPVWIEKNWRTRQRARGEVNASHA